MKKLVAMLLAFILLTSSAWAVDLEMESDTEEVPASIFEEDDEPALSPVDISIAAPSAILMEKETGTIIYEKNADERLEPASVTKVMTMLLIVEALESGSIALDDMVTTSAYAASMGGSQIYLEEGEAMDVRTLFKAIVVSSANDAAVAMAEHISGTEEAFVSKMNARAMELGMTGTVFMNCSGLLDQREHLTTARDVAVMSRELIAHDMVKEYTTIWMDTVRGGEFGLSNTNKLIHYYSGATGLKTGFTSRAGHCLSATAERDGVEYIAVVMNCGSSVDRFESAKTLLSFAFANYTLVSTTPDEAFAPVRVILGDSRFIQPVLADETPLLLEKTRVSSIEKAVTLEAEAAAPLNAGDEIGTLTISAGGETLHEVPIIVEVSVARLTWGRIFLKSLGVLFLGMDV